MTKPPKLELHRENIPPALPETPEEAAKAMGEFYAIVGNAVLNLIPILDRVNQSLEYIVTEISDMRDNMDRRGLKEGWLTEIDIAERDPADETEPG